MLDARHNGRPFSSHEALNKLALHDHAYPLTHNAGAVDRQMNSGTCVKALVAVHGAGGGPAQ